MDDVPATHLTVTIAEQSPGSCRLDVSGDLDLAGADALESALSNVPEGPALSIDLSRIEFIDSSGIRTLIQTRNQRDTSLVNPSRAVQRTFELANVEHLREMP